ncbi:cellulose synthase/poly-beta-1,6-N-acetylglucosamine synthase-like glycosyltransferase [Chitinophaga skermanii]|uniref:Cellulose synthase/poly-beta-1,6-N-acetylglucosamine synthase-like glycosyltransferase n=1 Tax=Chitinophaga skermanii TaxID=331697 RepID=A0A327QRP9_9BACT|nr:glycosyltransferase family 2 protein [Chitinophaga skermanii]RAJ06951.1 cellulose synthase/poly-beta-1,6-N-acetylglucosamine synthase-like glycosyltransferase [Chitinophaga skermanii]
MQTVAEIFNILLWIVSTIVAFYVLLPSFLLLIYGFKRLFGLSSSPLRKGVNITKEYSFGAIVAAHSDLTLVPPLVDSLLKQDYKNFTVYVVADNCTDINLPAYDERVKILAPETPFNDKTKSIRHAIEHFVVPHDAFIIFDSDNLVRPDYLSILNAYFNMGFRAVQTHMLPKNTDTRFAQMDAAGNHWCNFVDRLMHMEVGVSSAIWGLGVAIETELYKQILLEQFQHGQFKNLGGFDKKMQAQLVKSLPLLAYAEEAVVYDEKIQDGSKLQKQRTRWINAYFKSMHEAWEVTLHGLKKFRPGVVFFGINMLRPPLFMLMGSAGLLCLFNIWWNWPMAIFWAAAIASFVVSFFAIVTVMSKDSGIFKAMFFLPIFVWRQVKALLRFNDAKRNFLRTANTKVVYIDEILKKN